MSALIFAALAWASGQSNSAVETWPECSLVAPNGDAIAFAMPSWDASGAVGLIPGDGSVWPTRTLIAPKLGNDGKTFALGGENGLVIQLADAVGAVQPISIHRRDGDRAGIPLAYGFCRAGTPATVFRAYDSSITGIGDDIAAFSPQSWPSDNCAIILDDDRRMRIAYRIAGDRAQIGNNRIWPDGPVLVDLNRRRGAVRGVGVATFGRRAGPRGKELFHIDHDSAQAVKLLEFDAVGGAVGPDHAGFAICGYSGITRRPVMEN